MKALSTCTFEFKLVWNCLLHFEDLACQNKMRVPGHCKISGSAVVDWLARARSARLFTGPEPYSELSASHFGEVVDV